jgi:glycosyltransferase involved in cell wall biosynthesis
MYGSEIFMNTDCDGQTDKIADSKYGLCTGPKRFSQGSFIAGFFSIVYLFISRAMRGFWRRLPLSVYDKLRLKNALFKRLPFVFKSSTAYRCWKIANASSSESAAYADMLFQNADSGVRIFLPPGKPHQKKSEWRSCAEDISGKFGMNIAGSITSESGVGEAARADIRSIDKAGIPYVLDDVLSNSSEEDTFYTDFTEDNPYGINLVHLNADAVPVFLAMRGAEYLRNKYNIGYWFWELAEFPKMWRDRFKYFDEIWVASEFCLEAIAKVSPIPVLKMPPSVVMDPVTAFDRSHYRFREGSFIFFMMFDFFSYFERKNPLAVIDAFRMAFSPNEDVELLIKCSNSDSNKQSRARLTAAAKGLKIRFLDDHISKAALNALISLTDCYVSLHRSEGFGLPLAEAMYCGKPVIATGYSGNLEFMKSDNSFLVKYRLVEIDRDFGPYEKGKIWADPDTGHASELMRRVFEDRGLSTLIGEKAASDIKTYLNPEICGQRILDRLQSLKQGSCAAG